MPMKKTKPDTPSQISTENNDELEQLRRQNQLILLAIGEGVYGLDADGLAMFVNPAAEAMTGWTSEDLIGKSIHEFHHHSHADGSVYPKEDCRAIRSIHYGQSQFVDDEVFWRKDGSFFPVEYSSTPILEHGQIVGAVVAFRDISERKETEAALHGALSEVQRLKERLQAENAYLQEEIQAEHNFTEIIGESLALMTLLKEVRQVAPTEASVLIQGESGTGKELIARAIHNLSPRLNRPLVKVNCGAIASGLVESELFGHEKGAFTGALQHRQGRFELADGGTLFLDEVGELPPETQVKLLRVLQEKEFERVGSSKPIRINVRVIAATNRNLQQMVQDGSFRMDLFYRLSVFPLTVPPLRERRSDIPVLARYMLSKLSRKLGKPLSGVSAATMSEFMSYGWPGNIRELHNVLERVAISATSSQLELSSLQLNSSSSSASVQGDGKVIIATAAEAEREHLLIALTSVQGRISGKGGAAELLDLPASTLRSRMQRLNITRDDY